MSTVTNDRLEVTALLTNHRPGLPGQLDINHTPGVSGGQFDWLSEMKNKMAARGTSALTWLGSLCAALAFKVPNIGLSF